MFMDSYFPTPQLFSDLYSIKINGCGTVSHNRKSMPANSEPKMLGGRKGMFSVRLKDAPVQFVGKRTGKCIF